MPGKIKLKKGFDIRLKGAASRSIATTGKGLLYAVKPIDFPGLIPKLNVKPGDKVAAGDALFHDKVRPEILFTSPVSGAVVSVERGERRKMLEVVIEAAGNELVDFGKSDPLSISREEIIGKILRSGLWPAVRQRPYHVIANPADRPKSIFISGFDTSPLAPDLTFILNNYPAEKFRRGISAIRKLTDGKVHLILNGNETPSPSSEGLEGVDITYVSGPHPAGNTGVHIHHIDPLNKGEKIWFFNIQDVIAIGTLFLEGLYKPERIVALTGSEVKTPQYYRMLAGESVVQILKDNIAPGNIRVISGNVLTGTKITAEGFLGYYDSQVTVIPEGDYSEFFGWAKPGMKKYSFSGTFLSRLMHGREFTLDTNLHGGERAFVLTGQYEKVVPMDIYPMQLLKAILAEDIDGMENLGIYEIAEEDFALCEFICPSKTEIQTIVRQGLDLVRREMN